MNLDSKQLYDEFYVAYFDSRGNIVYPSDINEVKKIRKMLKNISSDNLIFMEDEKLCYKVRIKRKVFEGQKVQVVELSNVTEFFNQISNASKDEVTNLENRRVSINNFIKYIDIAYKRKEDFAILLADLDGFKNINDTFGHVTGDDVLSEISRILYCATRQEQYRERDIVSRYGGDEFLVIMKDITEKDSHLKTENIRHEVSNHKVPLFSEKDEVTYINAGTLSIGLYYVTFEILKELYDRGCSIEEIAKILIDRCDSALYESKNSGKNKITAFSRERKMA